MKKLNPNTSLPKVVGGHGRYGGLTYTLDRNKVQCHICGNFFTMLGIHTNNIHGIKARDYKTKFGFAQSASLCGDGHLRSMKKNNGGWLKSLSSKRRKKFGLLGRKKGHKVGKKYSRMTVQYKNEKGILPEQLLAKVSEVYKKLGHTPSIAEFINYTQSKSYYHHINNTFGSLPKAIKILKLPSRKRKSTKGEPNKRYTKQELLLFMEIYARSRKKIPRVLDCQLGIIPDYYSYVKHFGTFEKARQEAGVYKFVDYKNEK